MTAMIGMRTPLEETPAYKSIFAKGKAQGVAQGEAKGKAELLTQQIELMESSYREGLIDKQAYDVLVPSLRKQLEDVRRSLKQG